MSNKTIERGRESRVEWEYLEEWVCVKVQASVSTICGSAGRSARTG